MACSSVILFAWFIQVMEPLLERHKNLVNLASAESLSALDIETQLVVQKAEGTFNSDQVTNAMLVDLLKEIELVDETLQAGITSLIAPEKMVTVLRKLFDQKKNITLTQFKTIKAVVVTERGENSEIETGIYRHRIHLQFEGSYQSIVTYMKSIEQLPWPVYWQAVDYEQRLYPKARVSLLLDTFSTEREWIKL